MIEYGVRHYTYNHVDHTFDTHAEAVEWVSEREEPNEWRIYKRTITDWEEL